jgi:hypothetical protein
MVRLSITLVLNDRGAKLSDALAQDKQEKPTKSKQNRLRKRNNHKKKKNVTKFPVVFCSLAWIF